MLLSYVAFQTFISRYLLISVKYYHTIRKNTYEEARKYIVSQYEKLMAYRPVSILDYNTKNITSEYLHQVTNFQLICGLFLKKVWKNEEAVDKLFEVDVQKLLTTRNKAVSDTLSFHIYKIVYGNGSTQVVAANNVSFVDFENAFVHKVLGYGREPHSGQLNYSCPFVSIQLGNISFDAYIKKVISSVLQRNTLTTRDIVVMFCIDELQRCCNQKRIKEIVRSLLSHGMCLKYFDLEFQELEYKESDIIV